MRSLKDRLDLCSINTATLGFQQDIGKTVELIARKGFGAIAPWRRELEGRNVATVARQIRDAGLAVSGYCRSTYFPAQTQKDFEIQLEDNKRAVDQAATLGAASFVLVVGSLPEGSKDISRAREQVAEGTAQLLEYARLNGVRLSLEPLHPMTAGDRSCLNMLEQALDLCEQIEPNSVNPYLGVCIDVYHCWWDPKLQQQITRAGEQNRIFGFHVSDWLIDTCDLVNDRGMMGDGVIDLPLIRKWVEAAGYDGAVEVEIFSTRNWWKRAPEDIASVCAERLVSTC